MLSSYLPVDKFPALFSSSVLGNLTNLLGTSWEQLQSCVRTMIHAAIYAPAGPEPELGLVLQPP